jgi:DNA-binding LytR/AlgR family response regulator
LVERAECHEGAAATDSALRARPRPDRAVAAAEIERLEAADDCVEVSTRARPYFVYLTLSDFDRRLDPARFIRVDRAHIVNLDFAKQLVPFDGSRTQVAMRDGTKILTCSS